MQLRVYKQRGQKQKQIYCVYVCEKQSERKQEQIGSKL